MRRRTLIAVCLVAVVGVAGVGLLRVRTVQAAQRELSSTIEEYMAQWQAGASPKLIGPGSVSVPMPTLDAKGLRSRQFAVASAGTAGALAGACAAFAACLAIGWVFGSIRAAALMGLWAWFVNGAAVAAVMRYGAGLLSEMVEYPVPQTYGVLPVTSVTAFLVAGLASAFLWQSAIPAALGSFAGLKIYEWRHSLVEIELYRDEQPVWTPPAAPETSRRCACGAANLLDRRWCYACGALLPGFGTATAEQGGDS